jgi:pimeloyl-ACP methyl ester carboxylesterase
LQVAIRHPERVRKLVLASVAYNTGGLYPEMFQGFANLKAEDLIGSPFYEEYIKIAPKPQDFSRLFAKQLRLDNEIHDWSVEVIRSLKKPTLLILGDADIIRPEHTIELFRLLGGGVIGDLVGLPDSQLAILPGTTHVTLVDRASWLLSMIPAFLDVPLVDEK